jgi:hypothetical protein
MTSIVTSSEYQGADTGTYTTTTYAPSVASSSLPEKQIFPIVEELYIPDIGSVGQSTFDRLINSFFCTQQAPEIWLDSQEGEVMSIEIYDYTPATVSSILNLNFHTD